MAVIRNLVVKIAADISSLSKGLQTAQKKLKNVASSFTKIGMKMTASVTLPIVALGAAVVKTSAQFEQSILRYAPWRSLRSAKGKRRIRFGCNGRGTRTDDRSCKKNGRTNGVLGKRCGRRNVLYGCDLFVIEKITH